MKKKLIIILLILVIIGITIYLINYNKDPFKNYKTIKNYSDLVEINPNAKKLTTKTIDDEIKERKYIEELSSSLILGYSLYSSPFTDEITVVKDMEELELLNLTYIFMTNNQESVCIKEDYLKDMLHKYFRIDKDDFSNDVKEYLYSKTKRSYCFDSLDFDNVKLELINYQRNKNSIELKYKEENTYEEETYEWDIKFYYDKEGYYLYSFSNIIVPY